MTTPITCTCVHQYGPIIGCRLCEPDKWHKTDYGDHVIWEPKDQWLAKEKRKTTKVFSWWEEFGEKGLVDFVYKVERSDGTIAFVKDKNLVTRWKVIKKWHKNQFRNVNMNTLTSDECHAMGELLCGCMLHGQFLGTIIDELRICRQEIGQLRQQVNMKRFR